jgi:membrane protein
LLVFLNVLNQLVLFAAALAATATTGHVADLAVGPTQDTPAAMGSVQDTGSAETITESGGGSARR